MEGAILAIFWGIWLKEIAVFEDREEDVLVLWDKIKYWVSLWVYRDKEFGKPVFSDFVKSLAPYLQPFSFLFSGSAFGFFNF